MAMARRIRNAQVPLMQKIKAFWKLTNGPKGIASKKTRYFTMKDADMDRSRSALPTDVPKGHCAVYVGSERSRFIIPTSYLNHFLFRSLLDRAEEEYGFDHQMGLTIPCEELAFQHLTSMLGKKDYDLTRFPFRKAMDCTYQVYNVVQFLMTVDYLNMSERHFFRDFF